MLTTTTHSKLREALDGTDTQVATYAIDRWTAKMKRTEGYIGSVWIELIVAENLKLKTEN